MAKLDIIKERALKEQPEVNIPKFVKTLFSLLVAATDVTIPNGMSPKQLESFCDINNYPCHWVCSDGARDYFSFAPSYSLLLSHERSR